MLWKGEKRKFHLRIVQKENEFCLICSIQSIGQLITNGCARPITALAVLVTAGKIPLDLLLAEEMEIYKVKLAENHIQTLFENGNDDGNDDGTMKIE